MLFLFILMMLSSCFSIYTFAEETEKLSIQTWDGSIDSSWYDEEEQDFHLHTPAELAGISQLSQMGITFEKKNIYLENDINLNGLSWTSIPLFCGSFYGNNHIISGMKSSNGFFLKVKGASVEECVKITDIHFDNAYIQSAPSVNYTIDQLKAGWYNCNWDSSIVVGGVCQSIENTIMERCDINGDISFNMKFTVTVAIPIHTEERITISQRGAIILGGMLGSATNSKINNCKSNVSFSSKKVDAIANEQITRDSYSWHKLYAIFNANYYVGGICGNANNCIICNTVSPNNDLCGKETKCLILIIGDVNIDGSVDVADIVHFQKALLTLTTLNDTAAYCADLDFNGSINVVDLTLQKRMLINS